MNPTGRHQPHQVSGPAALLQFAYEIAQWRHGGELALGDCRIDARQVLQYHPSGPDIGVADFGIPHLAVGQADIAFARL